jgi:endonuclease-3 related protein
MTARSVRRLYSLLYRHFGPQHWWPADSAWEMMVGAILTQNTSWANVEKAITALKQSRNLSLRAVARMPRRRLEKLIRPTGYFRQKAERLQWFARALLNDREFYRILCDRAASRPPLHSLRDRLLSLHGIGPETADSILLYAAGYPIFVVDAYTCRIGQRMGLFKTNDYDEVQRYFHENCRGGRLAARKCQYNEFHALIVRLAKEVCTKHDPHCSICPLKPDCAYARGRK